MIDGIWKRSAWLLATGLGVGHIPVAPGTFGSLWGLGLVWAMSYANLTWWMYLATALALGLASVPICSKAASAFGQRDPGQIVLDEIVAFPLVFLWIPVQLSTGIAGFFFFRFFDILKPWPIRHIEELPGGWGIVADDLMAAAYAGAVLWLAVQIWNWY